ARSRAGLTRSTAASSIAMGNRVVKGARSGAQAISGSIYRDQKPIKIQKCRLKCMPLSRNHIPFPLNRDFHLPETILQGCNADDALKDFHEVGSILKPSRFMLHMNDISITFRSDTFPGLWMSPRQAAMD